MENTIQYLVQYYFNASYSTVQLCIAQYSTTLDCRVKYYNALYSTIIHYTVQY